MKAAKKGFPRNEALAPVKISVPWFCSLNIFKQGRVKLEVRHKPPN
ncbi:hypothetical protein J726_3768 [Acinetobacter baumannii 1262761-105]|nr:hypothetical protein J726_3768 [Acinetobacter baumannii 1262761-105]